MSDVNYTGFGDGAPWMQLHGGGAYAFCGSAKHDLEGFGVEGVAKALSRINRYTGHSLFPYSVAQHSVLVSKLLDFDAELAMRGLAHDAHECIIGDISSPLKLALRAQGAGKALDVLEGYADGVLIPMFGLTLDYSDTSLASKAVKHADLVALATEYRDIMDKRHSWKLPAPPHPSRIRRMTPERAERLFMARFAELRDRLASSGTLAAE